MNMLIELEELLPHRKELIRVFRYIINALDHIWHYKIVTVGEDSICISNIIIASFIFLFLMRFKQYVSYAIRIRLKNIKQIDPTLREALSKISDYILLAIIVLFTLKMSNVPTTAFAFVGGALAIALGLGSQNIINNFISGLIIMFEQPIKIGDIVTIGGDTGKVVAIGARCTHLLTGDQVLVLIPNSTLLQTTINNWTYDNDVIRTKIFFKLPYNNDLAAIQDTIFDVVKNSEGIIQDESTEVFISDFSENVVTYDVTFHVNALGEISKTKIISHIYIETFRRLQEMNIKIELKSKS